jgi:hypothetical protein
MIVANKFNCKQNTNTLRKTIRNIALFLFGIFSFPLIYQPFHVVVHHSHSHCTHCSVNYSILNANWGYQALDTAKVNEEPCPICNYHFPLNEIPAEYSLLQKIVFETGQIYPVPLNGYSKNIYSNLIPRAPPTC